MSRQHFQHLLHTSAGQAAGWQMYQRTSSIHTVSRVGLDTIFGMVISAPYQKPHEVSVSIKIKVPAPHIFMWGFIKDQICLAACRFSCPISFAKESDCLTSSISTPNLLPKCLRTRSRANLARFISCNEAGPVAESEIQMDLRAETNIHAAHRWTARQSKRWSPYRHRRNDADPYVQC